MRWGWSGVESSCRRVLALPRTTLATPQFCPFVSVLDAQSESVCFGSKYNEVTTIGPLNFGNNTHVTNSASR